MKKLKWLRWFSICVREADMLRCPDPGSTARWFLSAREPGFPRRPRVLSAYSGQAFGRKLIEFKDISLLKSNDGAKGHTQGLEFFTSWLEQVLSMPFTVRARVLYLSVGTTSVNALQGQESFTAWLDNLCQHPYILPVTRRCIRGSASVSVCN